VHDLGWAVTWWSRGHALVVPLSRGWHGGARRRQARIELLGRHAVVEQRHVISWPLEW
jgi:hypothetical protein